MTRLSLLSLVVACTSAEPRREAPPADVPESPPSAAPAAIWEGPGAFLPRPEVGGWRIEGGPRYFDAGSLYTYMNGQSDSYIEYGVVKLAIGEYRPATGGGGASRTVQVEVYDMGSAAGAFGRFSRIAVEGGDPAGLADRWIDLGGGGIASGTDLAFWKGSHLAKLTFLDESPDATEESLRSAARSATLPIARALAERLPGDSAPPSDLARFPPAGLIAHSQVRYGRALLGIEALGPGLGAEYAVDGKRMRLFFAERATAAEATAAFDAASATLEARRPIAALGDSAVRGADPQRGDVVVARLATTVLVVANSDTPDVPAGDAAAKTAVARAFLENH